VAGKHVAIAARDTVGVTHTIRNWLAGGALVAGVAAGLAWAFAL